LIEHKGTEMLLQNASQGRSQLGHVVHTEKEQTLKQSTSKQWRSKGGSGGRGTRGGTFKGAALLGGRHFADQK